VVEAVGAYFNNSRAAAKAQAISYVSSFGALVAGIVILFAKESQGVAFVWILGVYAIVVGTLRITELSASAK
jgi:uncharacterized membrane protein HdeD (DUF308 family)